METFMGKDVDAMEGRAGELYVLSSRSKEKSKAWYKKTIDTASI
jgi:hypothetical protein